jgi:class 3 adenylate cyclase
MPLFMDRHDIEGVTAKAVAEAHEKDLAVQDKHGAKYVTYWLDEPRGHIFCLCDAPSKEIAEQVHREAHGLVANHIMEVDPATVEAFLGCIDQSASIVTISRGGETAQLPATADGSSGSAFRAILFTDMKDSTALTRQLGDAKAMDLLRTHNTIVRETLLIYHGNEVKHTGDGFMVSFASVSKAVECAIAILRSFEAYNRQNPDMPIHVKIGLSAGEPIEENQDFFGATVQLAARLCGSAPADKILVSSGVRELCLGKNLPFMNQGDKKFKGFDRSIRVYEVDWTQG